MKVLFDHQIFLEQTTGGISKSFCEFIRHLPENGIDWELSVAQSNNIYLKDILGLTSLPPIKRSYRLVKPILGSNELGARWFTLLDKLRIARTAESLNKEKTQNALGKGDFDVFHPTYFNPYFLDQLGGKPFVLTVHDLIPESFPEFFRPSDVQIQGRRRLLDKASAIVTVSENTKRDLVNIYQVQEDRITVIYHGGPALCEAGCAIEKDHPYFLFVGGRSGYKNFARFIKAFAVFSQSHPEARAICTGRPFSQKELSELGSLSLLDKVQAVRVNETELNDLYRKALALIYPSQYEGFGMPILEAFANRCPVLTYPSSSLPEVGGDVAYYLEKDYRDFVEKLEFLYSLSDDDRAAVTEKGAERLSQFSWEKSARQYAEVYRSLL